MSANARACLGVKGVLGGLVTDQHKLLRVQRETGGAEVGGATTHRDAVAVHRANIGWGCPGRRGAQQRQQHRNWLAEHVDRFALMGFGGGMRNAAQQQQCPVD